MWESLYCSKLVHLVVIFGNVSVVQVFTVSLNREREASGKLYAVFKLTFCVTNHFICQIEKYFFFSGIGQF